MSYQVANRRVQELRTILDHANGLLVEPEEPQARLQLTGKNLLPSFH